MEDLHLIPRSTKRKTQILSQRLSNYCSSILKQECHGLKRSGIFELAAGHGEGFAQTV